jgi:hypothetical protein
MTATWRYRAEMINACNCDWGCPCNFNAKPTHGFCEGLYGAHIIAGRSGETALEGVKWAWGAKWPGAIHEGGGTGRIWIDETASAAQRQALQEILRGNLGGMPWTVLGATVDHWLETQFVPFEWHYDGIRSRYRAGTEVQTALESMRNAVSGQDASATVLLPNGIVAKELHVTATRAFSVFSRGLKFAAPGKYGFYCTVEHANSTG